MPLSHPFWCARSTRYIWNSHEVENPWKMNEVYFSGVIFFLLLLFLALIFFFNNHFTSHRLLLSLHVSASFVRTFCSYLSKVVNYKLMWLNPKTASPFTFSLIRLNMQYVIAHKSHRSLSLSFAHFHLKVNANKNAIQKQWQQTAIVTFICMNTWAVFEFSKFLAKHIFMELSCGNTRHSQ